MIAIDEKLVADTEAAIAKATRERMKLKPFMNNYVSNMMKLEMPLLNVLPSLKDFNPEEALLKSRKPKLILEN